MSHHHTEKKLLSAALFKILFIPVLLLLVNKPSFAQFSATITEINPDQSTLDATDPDGASGGRVNGLAVASDGRTFYAASEWGGIYKSTDSGLTWFRLDSHLPVATWDVEVDPSNANKVYVTSFYDGRVNSLAGINVSTDGGNTWTRPVTATPPRGFCASAARRNEPSAFGISIDPDSTQNVYIGTNCGLAISNDGGMTWRYVDPTPGDQADNVWDVVVHDGGIIDLVGDDGHQRSVDDGNTWTTSTGAGLPAGRSSITVSPDEPYVLFAVVGTTIYESDDGGASWPTTITNPRPQGRIPFVATNQRSGNNFDLWFGDVQLHRATCTTPVFPAQGGAPRCPINTWIGPFTRGSGGHDDVGDMVFDPTAGNDACPVLFSSDGGVYYNTLSSSPACQSPAWEQPNVTPHGLWLFGMDGADQPGLTNEDLYFGLQDNGTFATTNAGVPSPTWSNQDCCDGFDVSADPGRVLYTQCCYGIGRANRLFLRNPGMIGGGQINTYPPGNLRGFRPTNNIAQFGPDNYAVITTSGVFITNDITANPIVWTQLGATTTPATARGIKVGFAGGTPSFYVQVPQGDLRNQDQLWRYVGTATGGAWQQVNPPGGMGGFSIYDVDPNSPNRIFASHLRLGVNPQMVLSTDGGNNWTTLAALDNLMTGAGAFRYQNQRGPTNFTGFGGYPQPTLVKFDPDDSNIMVAGGANSGVFISIDGGTDWYLVTDPIDPVGSGRPHIPRPQFAYFDHHTTEKVDIYIGTQGRGVWRISLEIHVFPYEYAAKIVCGAQKESNNLRLARGIYSTTINIHNPNNATATFYKKLALTYPPGGQRPGKVYRISTDTLEYDEALETDCMDIKNRVFPGGLPTPYIEGFVVIRSLMSLDVSAVYTSTKPRLFFAPKVTSIDVEQIRERRKRKEIPDLIIESLTHSPANPTTADTITFTAIVKNVGSGSASQSTLALKIGGETFPVTFAVPTLDEGERFFVSRQLILSVSQNYLNTSTADFNNEVTESDETNNQKTDSYRVNSP